MKIDRRYSYYAGALLTALLLTPRMGTAAPVRGALQLPQGFTAPPVFSAPGHWLLANDVLAVLPPRDDFRREMVIGIEGDPAPDKELGIPAELVIEDSHFLTPVLPVHPGTRVKVVNRESILHLLETVGTSGEPPKSVGPGAVEMLTFNAEGTFTLRCSEVPHVLTTVLVSKIPLLTVPDDTGAFKFNDVKNGNYTLKVWFRNSWVHSQPLVVKGRTTLEVLLPASLIKSFKPKD